VNLDRVERKCRPLANQGVPYKEIAKRRRIPYKTVAAVMKHGPEGVRAMTRARKARYAAKCPDCGAPRGIRSSPNDGTPNSKCIACDQRDRRQAAAQNIIDAMHDFNQRYGRPPGAWDWNPLCRPWEWQSTAIRIQRQKRHGYPNTSQVIKIFGSWSEGLRAAGLRPDPKRDRSRGKGFHKVRCQ
jgi:Zn ribbon nucleic-acid-binding protein